MFASTSFTHNANVAAIFEWIIAFIFTFYVASFIIDLGPAVHTKRKADRFEKHSHDVEESGNGHANRHTNGHQNGRDTNF